MSELYERLAHALPTDHSRQASLPDMLHARLQGGWKPARALSLEADGGRLISSIQKLLPGVMWARCSVEAAAAAPSTSVTSLLATDGCELLCPDGRFDLVLVSLAIERLRRPESALRELRRVLKAGGLLLGQVAQFEALGQGALRNLTVHGLHHILEDAGLRLLELRPGIDGFTLMRRSYDGRPPGMSRYFVETSPINHEIELQAADRRPAVRNFRKLLYAGQVMFAAGDEQTPAALAQPQPPVLQAPVFGGSTDYWRQRYVQGQDSGAGSYGKFAAFKADVLNAVFEELGLRSAIEYGCGDGHQLGLLRIERYVGLDISDEALDRCRRLHGHDSSRRFARDGEHDGATADATLSLDVIYHLVEDDVFERYMRRLFDGATQLVAIYSSNVDEAQTGVPHVRHRRFDDWVRAHAPGWALWRHVPNQHPWNGDHRDGSFADFYLYRPAPACAS